MVTGANQVTHVNRIKLIADYENETSKQLEKSKPILKKKLGRPRKIIEQPAKEKQNKEVANEKQNSAQGEDERNQKEHRDNTVTPKQIPKRQPKKKAKNLDKTFNKNIKIGPTTRVYSLRSRK